MEPERKSISVILMRKWDIEGQYLRYLRHLPAYVIPVETLTGNKKVRGIGCGGGEGAE